MITRLNMLIFLQHDLEAAVEFYQKLGLKAVFHMKGRWAEFATQEGTTLGMCPISKKIEQPVRTGIVFEVDDLHAMHEQLKDEVQFINPPTEKEHGIIASAVDPGNNVIDLYQPTPEKLKEFLRQQKEAGCDACPEGCGTCADESCTEKPATEDGADESEANS